MERSGDGPLADAMLADEAEGKGGEDAVGGADDEAAIGGEEAGVEGSGREEGEVGEGEEGGCEAEVEGQEAEEDEEDCVHGCTEGGGKRGGEILVEGSVGGVCALWGVGFLERDFQREEVGGLS